MNILSMNKFFSFIQYLEDFNIISTLVVSGIFMFWLSMVSCASGATIISTVPTVEDEQRLNNAPIIGILTQESYSVDKYFPNENYTSYIAASYVKFVESGGARVVAIWIGQNYEYYDQITDWVNGVLFPGGATWFNQTDGYADAGVMIYNLSKQKNLPLFGICLGFELITYAAAGAREHRIHCNSKKMSLPLNFTEDYKGSKMFKNAPREIINILKSENVTYNFHQFCVTQENMTKFGLTKDEWRVMSLNNDPQGIEFVSSLESKDYPIYGVQFHPEKNSYEWSEGKGIAHGENAVKVSQYFSGMFINEARRNYNAFPSKKLESEFLIYNHPVAYTGKLGSSYQQCYMFK